MDIEKLAAALAPIIKAQVGKAVDAQAVADAVAAGFERRFGEMVLAWERHVREAAEKAIGGMPQPQPGKDGRDFSQPEFIYDGRRSFTIRNLVDGEAVEREFTLPLVIDAGFYREGTDYAKGDGVTFAGSYWIAQADTQAKPEIGNPDWRLAVKRGRDARNREVS